MKSRHLAPVKRPATENDMREIGLGILRREDVSALVSKVMLTEEQRQRLCLVNAEGASAAGTKWVSGDDIAPKQARFVQGGAPGLVQQK